MNTVEQLLPDFTKLDADQVREQVFAAIETYEQAITQLEAAEPTVADFLVPFDEATGEYDRVLGVAFTAISSIGGPQWNQLESDLNEPLTKLGLRIDTSDALYERFKTLAQQDLDEESAHYVQTELKDFEVGGITLSEPDRAQLEQLDLKIADLTTEYSQRVKNMLTKPAVVDGQEYPLNNFTMPLALVQVPQAGVRAQILEASTSRGWGSDPATDTRGLVQQITQLRDTRAKLLGFDSHADLVLETETATSTTAVRDLRQMVGTQALKRVEEEAQTLQADAQADGLEELRASDWPYYEQRRKHHELGLSDEALSPYLELWHVLEKGVFYAAQKLYGITLVHRPDLTGIDDSSRVYEVSREDGQPLGLFIADPYTRDGKSGGAWMNELVTGYAGNNYQSIIINCANFTPPEPGHEKHLVWDEVETCFHEFGHALHGFLSRTRYHGTGGTNVPRDFVEFPSQLNEMWAFNPSVIASYARNKDGEVLPEELRVKLAASKSFGQPYSTAEYCAAALLDQYWYSRERDRGPADVGDYEQWALQQAGMNHPLVPPRYRTTYFPHAFTVGYDAGYYSYMWSEMLVGEVEQWFAAHEHTSGDGGLNREAGQQLERAVLSRGNSREPMDSFRALLGRDPRPEAVVQRRGL